MSDLYPECAKMLKLRPQLDVVGDFLEWLQGQRLHLMTYREDLTDERMTDPQCSERKSFGQWPAVDGAWPEGHAACKPNGLSALREGGSRWDTHCMHWHDPELPASEIEHMRQCCLCGKGWYYEVTGIRSWVEDGRSFDDLLAAFFEIDQRAIEKEKRAMLDAIRRNNP